MHFMLNYIHDKCLFNMLSIEHKICLNILKLVSHSRTYRSHVIMVLLLNALVSDLSQLKYFNNTYSYIISQTDFLKDQLTTLSNQCTNLIRDKQPSDSLHLNSIYNVITNLPDTINSTTSKSFADIFKSVTSSTLNPTPSSSHSSNISNINPSIVIDHISTTDRNISYINLYF